VDDIERRMASWLREVNLEPGASRQEGMVRAAEALAGDSSGESLLDMVLVACGASVPPATERISAALNDVDKTWDVRPGDRELFLTAAAAVAIGMQDMEDAGVEFALAVRSAVFLRLTPTIDELPQLAKAALVRASEKSRGRIQLQIGSAEGKGMLDAPDFGDDQPISPENLNTVLKATRAGLSKAVGVTSKLLPNLNSRLEATEEELDLLWWVIGGFSELADKPIDQVPTEAVGCVCGIELTAHTRRTIPLPSVRAMLSRSLGERRASMVGLTNAVPAVCNLVGRDWIPGTDGHRLLPIVSSAMEFAALGDPGWVTSISRWGIDPAHEASSLDLGEQVGTELLLASRH
jgi:hypothetical protein